MANLDPKLGNYDGKCTIQIQSWVTTLLNAEFRPKVSHCTIARASLLSKNPGILKVSYILQLSETLANENIEFRSKVSYFL